MTQPRIDTGSWTQKGRNAKEAIGKAWLKFFHIAGVPGRQADNPYFISAVRETQKRTFQDCYPSFQLEDKLLLSTTCGVQKRCLVEATDISSRFSGLDLVVRLIRSVSQRFG